MTEQTICSDCRQVMMNIGGKIVDRVRLCQRHANLEKLEEAAKGALAKLESLWYGPCFEIDELKSALASIEVRK